MKVVFFLWKETHIVCDSHLQEHIPDNSDENPVENLDAWHEAEAKAKTTQAANVGKEIKTWHPSAFLVLWWDRIANLAFRCSAADIH